MTQVVVLQEEDNCAPVIKLAQHSYPLRPIVNVRDVGMPNSAGQGTQPKEFLVSPRPGDMAKQFAHPPHRRGEVRKRIFIGVAGRKPEHFHREIRGQPAIYLVRPACQCPAVIRAEGLST